MRLHRTRQRVWTAVVRRGAAVMSLALVTTVAAPGYASAAPPTLHLPNPQQVTVLPHTVYSGATHNVTKQKGAASGARSLAAAWPAAASASVNLLSAPAGAETEAKTGAEAKASAAPAQTSPHQAGTLPVAVNWPEGAKSGPSGVNVRMLAHSAATAAGASGVIMSLTPTGTSSGRLSVALDYSAFREAAGGDYGDRLRLVQLPACALTTPKLAACRTQTPLDSQNDGQSDVVSAQVAMPAAASATASQASNPLVLAAVSGTSGGNGDYTASTLSPSGTWNEGGAAGNFTWTYPIELPPPAAGSAPTLALNYDSSSVDGRISTTNNQFGPIGEGFTLTSSYIARSYTDCADDPEGAIAKDYDQCWAGQVVTLSLDGKSTPLVVDSSGAWHEQQDSGDQVQYLTGSAADTGNGTYDNGYWVVTTTDGTRYYFGKNKGPGWQTGDPVTNSAWTEPVYGAHAGDPCYSTAGFAKSSCAQAWQWNLDFVIDAHGNSTAYYYDVETNDYSADNPSYTSTAANDVSYDRDGYPTSIEYGLREDGGSIYGSPASDKVEFATAERCNPSSSFSCDPSQFNAANAADWPDTPQDLQCLPGAVCTNYAPSIWSTKRITGITTEYYNGSGYTDVDNYALNQNLTTGDQAPACGNVKDADPEMLLCSVVRTGYTASGTSLVMPPVSFTYQAMANRVAGYNTQPSMAHWRLTNIATDTGGTIDIAYANGCTASTLPASPSANTTLCYPVNWTPEFDTAQINDYFDKYVVSSVKQQDGTAGSPDKLTTYEYYGLNHTPDVAAWHYDDNELVKAADRTWGQFRGFAEVDTYTGDPNVVTNGTADAQTLSTALYYLGMNGDTLPNNATRSVSLTDSIGETVPDDDAFADSPYETDTFDGPGGAELSATITNLTTVAVTGSRARTGLPALQSAIVRTSEQRTVTPLAAGGTESTTTTTSYDSAGRPVLADSTGTAVPETCTSTAYAGDPATNPIRDKPSEVVTAQQACPSSPGNLTAGQIVADTRTYYDGSTTLGALPGPGDATETDKAATDKSGTLTFVKTEAAYDAMGRQTSATDADRNTTQTTYTPALGGPLTGETTTNAAQQQTTTTLDPGRGSTLSSKDPAGYLTTSQYDALGRLTAVWKPGRSQASGAAANVTYSYQVSATAPLAVTTNTLVDYGTGTHYVTSISVYDSFGQLRQTQTAAEGGNMVVTDSFYDSHGLVWLAHDKYVTGGAPTTNLIVVSDTAVSDRRINTYDASGRLVRMSEYNGSTLTDSTQTVYGGDRTTTIKRDASGNVIDTPLTTVTDVRGHTTQKDQYTAAPAVDGSVVTGGTSQATTTTFDALGNATKITDPSGDVWSYGYDLLGRQTSETDPDTGTTAKVYDAAGNLSSTTDARGVSDNYTYDDLNRKKAEYTGSTTPGSGTEVASWTWDTLAAGKLSSSSTYSGSNTYTTAYLGYDSYGNTTGTKIIIPTGQTGLAGTYKTQNTYSSTGLMTTLTPAEAGGLPIDSIDFTYDEYGNVTGESGYDTYVSQAAYTPYNELSQITLGAKNSTYAAALTYGYDPKTRKTTDVNLVDLQAAPQVDDTQYTYDADGQTTKITDTEGATGTAPADTQCFTYDGLNRMTEAWTATDGCAADPATAGNTTVGGPSPYWQSWTFDALGDRRSQTDHAVPGGTAATATTTYSYGVAGHAHAISSTQTGTASTDYTYDQSGDMTSGPGANPSTTLTWNQDGKLAADGTSSYVYDADGNELIQNDAGSSTLYLPGEQITYTKTTGATSGVRYYTLDGQTIAESDGATLYWLDGSLDGSKTLAVDAFDQSDVVRRALTPYGDARTASGSGPGSSGSAAWPDNRGFLDDPTDQDTGLTDVGARQYDAALGIFISPDLLLDTNAPQSMTGYGYGGGNPLMNVDVTGESWWSAITNVVNTVAKVAAVAAPVLDVVAAATAVVPGLDVVTAAVAGAANIVNGVAQVASGTVNVINDVRGGKGWLQTGLDAANIVMGAVGVSAGRNALSALKSTESATDEIQAGENAAKDSEPAPKESAPAKPRYTPVDLGDGRVNTQDAGDIWKQWEQDWKQSDAQQGPTDYSVPGDELPLRKPEDYFPEEATESAEKGAHEGLDTLAEMKHDPHDPHVDYEPVVTGGPEFTLALGIMAYAGARKMLQLLEEGK